MLSVANIKWNDGHSQQLSPGKEYLEVLFLKIFLRELPPAAAADLGSKHISHLSLNAKPQNSPTPKHDPSQANIAMHC